MLWSALPQSQSKSWIYHHLFVGSSWAWESKYLFYDGVELPTARSLCIIHHIEDVRFFKTKKIKKQIPKKLSSQEYSHSASMKNKERLLIFRLRLANWQKEISEKLEITMGIHSSNLLVNKDEDVVNFFSLLKKLHVTTDHSFWKHYTIKRVHLTLHSRKLSYQECHHWQINQQNDWFAGTNE